MILRDYLALDRTILALERTFLAYARTALGLLSAGIACVKFVVDVPNIYILGMVLIVAAPVVFICGLIRFLKVQKRLKSIPESNKSPEESNSIK